MTLILVFYAIIRDYVGFGPARLIIMVSLIVCYSLLYIAEPNGTDNLLYAWMLQYGAGVGLIVSYQQFSRMFPNSKGLILGIFNSAGQASTLWPQVWAILIDNGYLTLKQIYLIWIAMTIVSLVLGTLLLPWYSTQEETAWTGDTKYDSLYHVIKKDYPLIEKRNESFKQQIKTNVQYLASPILFV